MQTFTADHPYVQAYLAHAAAAVLEAEERSHEPRLPNGCANARWHELSDHDKLTNWWRVEYGGVARPESVADALNLQNPSALSVYDTHRIFAVAALAVYNFPTHPAHWAFWAKNARHRVADIVHEVVCEKPSRIVFPRNVSWIDVEYNLLCLRTYQQGWLPLIPRPSGEHQYKAPQKKPAPAKTRTSARRGRKPAATVAAEPEPSEKNVNGKRGAPEDMGELVELPAAKRQKPAAKAVGKSTKGQTKAKRATRSSVAPVGEAYPGQPPQPKTRARTRAATKPAETRPAETKPAKSGPSTPFKIRITPPSKIMGEYRDPGTPLDASSPLSPLSSLSSTPSKSASSSSTVSPAPRRPSGLCLPRRAMSEARSDYSGLSLAASASLTLVESTSASDACSTRAGTPPDVDVFGEVKKVVKRQSATLQTPMRASARIRARGSGSSSPGSTDPSPLGNHAGKTRRT